MNLRQYLHFVSSFATLWILLGTPSPCQEENLGHQSWSTENGLPQNSVHQIFQASDGYIWIATEGGIARFNGIDFKIFNLENTPAFTSDDTCCFAQDHSGALWIGTADGLIQYIGGRFRRYFAGDGLPSGRITNLAISDDGFLLVLTTNGISRFDGKQSSPLLFPSSAIPSAMVRADDGIVRIASGSSIFQYQNSRVIPQSLLHASEETKIIGIGLMPDHSLWYQTKKSLLLLQNGQSSPLLRDSKLPNSHIQSVLAGSQGELWIGTDKGLFVLDGTKSPRAISALGGSSILSLMQDKEGNLWVGTETGGLNILRQQNFRTIERISDHAITAITQTTDGSIWVGTSSNGLDSWHAGIVHHFSTQTGLLSETILSLAAGADGSVWVGTPDGLNHIHGTKVQNYTSADGLPDDLIRSILMDDDGSLWVGTRRGLAHWQNGRFVTLTRADGLGSDLVGALLLSHASNSHTLWIGTLNGLSRIQNSEIATFTKISGLSGDTITSLAEGPNGMLWIGTKGEGLNVLSGIGFTSLHRKDLPQTIDSIIEDDLGNLWLSSDRGITKVSASLLIKCGSSSTCNPHPVTYGRADGMPTEESIAVGHPSAYRAKDGLLWFATRRGVAITDPKHSVKNAVPPPVVIERFTTDGVDLPITRAEQNVTSGHINFVVEYAGLSYTAPAKVHYRYILEGFDKEWNEVGSRRIAYYTNLPPRRYRFRVQAANNDGVWNEIGAQISFYVQPPFYRRFWFLLLILVAVAALTFFLYRIRVRGLQSRFQAVLAERNRMAREIHDTLAQSFVGVSVQLEIAGQLLAQSKISAASQQIDRTRVYVREGLAEARRSIWNLRAVVTQESLPTRFTSLVEQWNKKGLNAHLNITGSYRPLVRSLEDEVFRIAQESLENVSRHASATQVLIDLRYDPKRLILVISDDGCGFNLVEKAVSKNGHFGLQGMRERAAQIHAQLIVEGVSGTGTKVMLEVPIAEEKGATSNG
ncbi:two-component regulator propeller domain-containing protein [Granulicella sp. S190]|uniref:ligand-binding sensor domain-containing protein n=1 Tax=Granulicella sp. S190 TaxID=1747226 RepID=UPI00131B37BE|nr:sensor histidine kinase [Granulicella sp. S190]